MNSSSIDRWIKYCTHIAQEFEARLNRIRAFVPNHNLTSGTTNESILRNFLAAHVAERYKVGQGFICDPSGSASVSKQCDILVHDHYNYPRVYADGDIEVVFPDSVKMLIEVKTYLGKKDLCQALENIEAGRCLNSLMNGVIFAFRSPKNRTVIDNLKQYSRTIDSQHIPIAILLLDKGTIIHRWPGSEVGGSRNTYEVRVSKDQKTSIVIAFLLLHFFEAQMLGVIGGAQIENILRKMLNDHTEVSVDSLTIGENQI